jgi:hypothetical protein
MADASARMVAAALMMMMGYGLAVIAGVVPIRSLLSRLRTAAPEAAVGFVFPSAACFPGTNLLLLTCQAETDARFHKLKLYVLFFTLMPCNSILDAPAIVEVAFQYIQRAAAGGWGDLPSSSSSSFTLPSLLRVVIFTHSQNSHPRSFGFTPGSTALGPLATGISSS